MLLEHMASFFTVAKSDYFFFLGNPQLMVNGWFWLVVWDSRDTPKNPNPFHQEFQITIS